MTNITYQFIEEEVNNLFKLQNSVEDNYFLQLLNFVEENKLYSASEILSSLNDELIKKAQAHIINLQKDNQIISVMEEMEKVVSNWEFIISEFLKTMTPFKGIQLLANESSNQICMKSQIWFLGVVGQISTEMLFEIEELHYSNYKKYISCIRRLFNKVSFCTEKINQMEISYYYYCDAYSIQKRGQEKLTINRLARLMRNLNYENQILKKFNLKLVNYILMGSVTKNVLLSAIIRYAVVSKMTNQKPNTLIVEKFNWTYDEIIEQIQNLNRFQLELNEDETQYICKALKEAKITNIPIMDLI